MEITLENSQIKLYLKIGDSETVRILIFLIFDCCFTIFSLFLFLIFKKILFSKERMNDNQWHTIKIMREGIRLIFQVDINEPSTGILILIDFILSI